MKKILAIINPAAGSRSGEEVRAALDACFPRAQADVTIYETTGDENIPQLVDQYLSQGDFDLVLVAGGDGTVSAVANGIHGHDVPLGIIPVGTGNAVAQELGLTLAVKEICEQFAADACHLQPFDAIKLDERYYLLHLSVGLGAQVMHTSRSLKNRFGILAYLWTLIAELRHQAANRYHLTVDGREVAVEGLEVLVANAAALGIPSLNWGGHIRPDDGVIDICILQPQKWVNYLSIIWNILRGRPEEDRFVRYIPVRERLRIESLGPNPIEVSGDGERVGNTPLEMTVVPSFINLLKP